MDKHRERDILDKYLNLFKLDRIGEIKASERPDFLITDGNETLGVEITELYINDTMARISNKEGYLEMILEGKVKMNNYRVNVSNVTIRRNEESFSCKALLTEFNEDSFSNNLLSLITSKESKCSYYLTNCSECTLIIHFDEMIDLYLEELNRFIDYYDVLFKTSSFSEIILITRDYESKNVFFYLKSKKNQLR